MSHNTRSRPQTTVNFIEKPQDPVVAEARNKVSWAIKRAESANQKATIIVGNTDQIVEIVRKLHDC